jgi:hypothetical protein
VRRGRRKPLRKPILQPRRHAGPWPTRAVSGTALAGARRRARAALSRSCLIFESKRMPRRRYTAFDLLPRRNQFRSAPAMDMYNRMPRPGSWQIIAPVRAVLTTVFSLLTPRAAACRVHRAFSTRIDKECSMMNVQWKDPARRAHRSTPIETKAGQPRDAWSILNLDSPRGASG